MANIRFNRGRQYAADMAIYSRQVARSNTAEVDQLKRNLIRAIREELTPRQREMIYLYYGEKINMPEISRRAGISVSTVSRTIKRAERTLQRCLRYGATSYLRTMYENEPLP